MGAATETYLAGPDNLMRSDSRLFLEDPKEYRREAIAAGTPPDVVDKAIRLGGTTLVQPVPSAGLRAAQRGRDRDRHRHRLHGQQGDGSLCPVERFRTPTCTGRFLATRDDSDAFARLGKFSKTLVIAVTAMIFVICVASMLLRPGRRCGRSGGSRPERRRSAPATTRSSIPVTSRDEIGDLTAAFNEMSRNLAIKEELLNEQRERKRSPIAGADARVGCATVPRAARRPSPRSTRTSP